MPEGEKIGGGGSSNRWGLRKVVIEEWLAVSSILVGSTASHPTNYNLP